MDQRTVSTLSKDSRLKMIFCTLLAELIQNSISSFIPFFAFTIIEMFQNCVSIIIVSQNQNQNQDSLSSVFQMVLLVKNFYFQSQVQLFTLVSVISVVIFLFFVAFLFIIVYKHFKQKKKIQIPIVIIAHILFLLMEKFLCLPFIIGILNSNADSFQLNTTTNIVVVIAKYFLIFLFIIPLFIESIFFNNDIPNTIIEWSMIPIASRALTIFTRVFIGVYLYYVNSQKVILIVCFIIFHLFKLLLYIHSPIPQSRSLYFLLIFQCYISIIYSFFILILTQPTFLIFFYTMLPSIILTQITFTKIFSWFDHSLNEFAQNKINIKSDYLVKNLRYLLHKCSTFQSNSRSDNSIIYSFLATHQLTCQNDSCSCQKLDHLLCQRNFEENKVINEENLPLIQAKNNEYINNKHQVKKEEIDSFQNLLYQLIIDILSFHNKSKDICKILLEKSYIYFSYLNNPYLAMSLIVKINQQTNSFFEYFRLYVLYNFIQSKLEKKSIEEDINDKSNSNKLLLYQIKVYSFVKSLNKACIIAENLWKAIVRKNFNIKFITTLAEKLLKKDKSLKQMYDHISKEFGSGSKISLFYSIFITEITGNTAENIQILDEAKSTFSSLAKINQTNSLIENLFGLSNQTFCFLISLNPNNYNKILDTTSDAAKILNYTNSELVCLNIRDLTPETIFQYQEKNQIKNEELNNKENKNRTFPMILMQKNNTIIIFEAFQKVTMTNEMDVNYYLVFSPLKNLNGYFNSYENIYTKNCLLFLLNEKNIIVNYNDKVFELLQINQRIEIQSKKKTKTIINIYELCPELALEDNLSNAKSETGLKITINLYPLIEMLKKELEDYVEEDLTERELNRSLYDTTIYIRQESVNKVNVCSVIAINLRSSSMEDANIYGNEDENYDVINSKIENKVEEPDVPDLMSSSVSSMSSSMSNFGQSVKMKNSISIKIESKLIFFESVRKYCYILFLIYAIQITAIVISHYLEESNDESMHHAFEEVEELTNFLAYIIDDTIYFRVMKNIIEKEEYNYSSAILDRYSFYFNLSVETGSKVENSNDILTNLYFTDPFYKGLVDQYNNISVLHIPHNEEESYPLHPYEEYLSLKNLCDEDVNAIFILFNIFKSYKERLNYTTQEMDDLERYLYFLDQNTLDSLLYSFRVILFEVEKKAGEILINNSLYTIILLICVLIAFLILTLALSPLILGKMYLCSKLISFILKSKFFSFAPILDKVSNGKLILNETFFEVKRYFSKLINSLQGPKDYTNKVQGIEDKILLKKMKETEKIHSDALKKKIYKSSKNIILIRILFPLFIFLIVVGTFIIIAYNSMKKGQISLIISERLFVIQPLVQLCVRILKDNIVFGKIELFDDTNDDKLLSYLDEFQENMENTTDIISRNKEYFPLSGEIYKEFQTDKLCDMTNYINNKEDCKSIENGVLLNGFAFSSNYIGYVLKRNYYIIRLNLPKNASSRAEYNNDHSLIDQIDLINLYFNPIIEEFENKLKEDRTNFFEGLDIILHAKLIILIILATLSSLYWILFVLTFIDRQISLTYSLLIALPNEVFAEFFTLYSKEITNII